MVVPEEKNYSLWLQGLRGSYFSPVAKLFQLSQARIYLAFPVELIVIISSKILENYTILEYVIYRCQHGMSNSDIGTFFPTMRTDPLELCACFTDTRHFLQCNRCCFCFRLHEVVDLIIQVSDVDVCSFQHLLKAVKFSRSFSNKTLSVTNKLPKFPLILIRNILA